MTSDATARWPIPSAGAAEHLTADEFFAPQPTSTNELPDPRPLLANLTRCVMEVLAGAREVEQLARWVTDDVYKHLLKRVVLAARARSLRGQSPSRPNISIGTIIIDEPRDGAVEAVVMVHGRGRSRAVAIRLEGLDSRWRACAIHVL
ncbi:Rv3235 family protein [Rathayibacter sp. YIM 133350]|uniref:Rv3235 family protein n=1 Tax=Rathayibacter sp. YIM 133350 TaxID=3131992 RepID=UPI00307E9426